MKSRRAGVPERQRKGGGEREICHKLKTRKGHYFGNFVEVEVNYFSLLVTKGENNNKIIKQWVTSKQPL